MTVPGNSKLNSARQYLTISILDVRNNFMKNRLTTKFNELMSDLRSGHASKPYSNAGMHLVRMISIITSSDAHPPILPSTAFAALKKDRFAMLKEHLKVLELTMWIPRYLTSLTHGIIWPDKLTTLAHETS